MKHFTSSTLIILLVICLTQIKLCAQDGNGGIKLDLFSKPNQSLDTILVEIINFKPYILRVDSGGSVPFLKIKPGTYDLLIKTKPFNTVLVKEITVLPNKLSFQKIIFEKKRRGLEGMLETIYYKQPSITN